MIVVKNLSQKSMLKLMLKLKLKLHVKVNDIYKSADRLWLKSNIIL